MKVAGDIKEKSRCSVKHFYILLTMKPIIIIRATPIVLVLAQRESTIRVDSITAKVMFIHGTIDTKSLISPSI